MDTHVGERFAAPLGEATSGQLIFRRGAAHLRIGVDGEMTDLYRARFQGKVPSIDVDGGTVTVTYRLGLRPPRGELTLSGRIPWRIEGHMGMSDVVLDLEDARVLGIDVSGGSSRVDLRLPRPDGTVSIRIGGGASGVELLRPADVPVSVRVARGASNVTVDDVVIEVAAGKNGWRTPGYEAASHRYDVEIGAGASAVTVR
jgi:hypothetical protein